MNSPVSHTVENRPATDEPSSTNEALSILVVDDEPSILELVKVALESLESYRVTTANGAEDAMHILNGREQPFDCLLLDIQMPDVNGIQLLRQVRTLEGYADTPAIMLTAMSERKYIDDAFLEGATDYISKPFDFFELRSRIRCAHKLIEARKGHDSTPRPEAVMPMEPESGDAVRAEPAHQEMARPETRQIFHDPLAVEDVDRILRDVEFDNYLDQLARQKLLKSQAIAIKLQDADQFFRAEGEDRFRGAVQDLASAIQYATKDLDRVFSYRGSGIFIVIVHGRRLGAALPNLHNLDEMITVRLSEHLDNGHIRFAVGKPIPMAALSRSRAAKALQQAVDQVQMLKARSPSEASTGRRTKTRLFRPTTRSEDRMYEQVLHELYGNSSYLKAR